MPRAYEVAVVYQVQKDRARIAARTRHPMEWNGATRPKNVDNNSLAQGIWLPNPWRGHGNTEKKVCRK